MEFFWGGLFVSWRPPSLKDLCLVARVHQISSWKRPHLFASVRWPTNFFSRLDFRFHFLITTSMTCDVSGLQRKWYPARDEFTLSSYFFDLASCVFGPANSPRSSPEAGQSASQPTNKATNQDRGHPIRWPPVAASERVRPKIKNKNHQNPDEEKRKTLFDGQLHHSSAVTKTGLWAHALKEKKQVALHNFGLDPLWSFTWSTAQWILII